MFLAFILLSFMPIAFGQNSLVGQGFDFGEEAVQDYDVHLYVSNHEMLDPNKISMDFQRLVESATDDFPRLYIQKHVIHPSDKFKPVNVSIPSVVFRGHAFTYQKSVEWLKRWFRDAMDNEFSLVTNNTNIKWDKRNPVSVHILGNKHFHLPVTQFLPDVAFGWNYMPKFKFNFTSIVRGVHGRINMRHTKNLNHLLRDLLPPITPKWMIASGAGLQIASYMPVREVHIIDEYVNPAWYNLTSMFPHTIFIHMLSNETDIVGPVTMTFHRSLEYTYNGTGPDAVSWFLQVVDGNAEPSFRFSNMPEDTHPAITELTGDSLLNWTDSVNESFVYVYDSEVSASECEDIFAERGMNGTAVGRFHMGLNDHESFGAGLKPGYALKYVNRSVVRYIPCDHENILWIFSPKTNKSAVEQNNTDAESSQDVEESESSKDVEESKYEL
jgi:hypothetical protein